MVAGTLRAVSLDIVLSGYVIFYCAITIAAFLNAVKHTNAIGY
jgi:hypothetical protein